jgi:hypothetical protein
MRAEFSGAQRLHGTSAQLPAQAGDAPNARPGTLIAL